MTPVVRNVGSGVPGVDAVGSARVIPAVGRWLARLLYQGVGASDNANGVYETKTSASSRQGVSRRGGDAGGRDKINGGPCHA